jgi:hypothetical protein
VNAQGALEQNRQFSPAFVEMASKAAAPVPRTTAKQRHQSQGRFLYSRPGDDMGSVVRAVALKSPKGVTVNVTTEGIEQVAKDCIAFTAVCHALSEPARWNDDAANPETIMLAGDEFIEFLEACESAVADKVGELAHLKPLGHVSRHGDRFVRAKLGAQCVYFDAADKHLAERPELAGRSMYVMGELKPWSMHGEYGLSLRLYQIQPTT